MSTHHGRCSCGAVTVIAEGEPLRVSACHCQACQRRTGSVVGIQARFDADQVHCDGVTHTYSRTAESGNVIDFRFCPQCATILWYQNSCLPGVTLVPVGVFADRAFPPPSVTLYTEYKPDWLRLDCPMECLD